MLASLAELSGSAFLGLEYEHGWFVAMIAICGSAAVIVLPYVIIDFLSLPKHEVSSAEWAAWAQAIGSVLAVAAAAFVAIDQSQSGNNYNEQRERKHFAARALLPATLSELDEYCNTCLNDLMVYEIICQRQAIRQALKGHQFL